MLRCEMGHIDYLFAFTPRYATVAPMLPEWRLSTVMTELLMKKIATIALALGLSASTAFAGGYVAPVVEAEPVVVEGSSSSNAAWLIPVLLVAGIAVIAND